MATGKERGITKEELLKEEGVYELDDVIWYHLSPIVNWYHLLRSLSFTCPFCGGIEKDFVVDTYRPENNYGRKTETKPTHEHQHREVTFACVCGQKFGLENFDYYRGEER